MSEIEKDTDWTSNLSSGGDGEFVDLDQIDIEDFATQGSSTSGENMGTPEVDHSSSPNMENENNMDTTGSEQDDEMSPGESYSAEELMTHQSEFILDKEVMCDVAHFRDPHPDSYDYFSSQEFGEELDGGGNIVNPSGEDEGNSGNEVAAGSDVDSFLREFGESFCPDILTTDYQMLESDRITKMNIAAALQKAEATVTSALKCIYEEIEGQEIYVANGSEEHTSSVSTFPRERLHIASLESLGLSPCTTPERELPAVTTLTTGEVEGPSEEENTEIGSEQPAAATNSAEDTDTYDFLSLTHLRQVYRDMRVEICLEFKKDRIEGQKKGGRKKEKEGSATDTSSTKSTSSDETLVGSSGSTTSSNASTSGVSSVASNSSDFSSGSEPQNKESDSKAEYNGYEKEKSDETKDSLDTTGKGSHNSHGKGPQNITGNGFQNTGKKSRGSPGLKILRYYSGIQKSKLTQEMYKEVIEATHMHLCYKWDKMMRLEMACKPYFLQKNICRLWAALKAEKKDKMMKEMAKKKLRSYRIELKPAGSTSPDVGVYSVISKLPHDEWVVKINMPNEFPLFSSGYDADEEELSSEEEENNSDDQAHSSDTDYRDHKIPVNGRGELLGEMYTFSKHNIENHGVFHVGNERKLVVPTIKITAAPEDSAQPY